MLGNFTNSGPIIDLRYLIVGPTVIGTQFISSSVLPFISDFSLNRNPSGSGDRSSKKATISMADSVISLDKIKDFWNAQVQDDEKWAFNMKFIRAAGLFGGSIFLMRQFGDLMAV